MGRNNVGLSSLFPQSLKKNIVETYISDHLFGKSGSMEAGSTLKQGKRRKKAISFGKSWSEECAVFGIYNSLDACYYTLLGLHAQQHRGQEASGIVCFDEKSKKFYSQKNLGLVGDSLNKALVNNYLEGKTAIGHNRYSTTSKKDLSSIQPFIAEIENDTIAIAHNGNLVNALTLRKALKSSGAIFQSLSDTEVFIHLIAQARGNIEEKLLSTLSKVRGAYSMVMLTKEALFAIRDPLGIRPLQLGKLGDNYVVASESCAFDIIGAKFIRDIKAGEIVKINKEGISSMSFRGLPSMKADKKHERKFCVFEYIYFARPDSLIEGKNVYNIRKNLGRALALESKIKADIVVPIPDSGVPAALGYAIEAKLPFDYGLIRNHYVGRTFIEPDAGIRDFGVKLKHNINKQVVCGKDVLLVDDSLVRGTTSKKIITMIKEAGAKKVHLVITSPPITHPCYYGIDTPNKSELIASRLSIKEMAKLILADSLTFLSYDAMYKAIGKTRSGFCDACFSGNYPIPYIDKNQNQLSLNIIN